MDNRTEEIGSKKLIVSVSAISFNFDMVSSDPNASRADEIRVLLPKNKKPPKGSKEGKPPGRGTPTGQVEERETLEGAVERESEHETGYSVTRIIGKTFIIDKPWVPNDIHVFITESSDYCSGVKEKNEIDHTIDPWCSLKEVFSMPHAQDKLEGNRNPNGIYFSHKLRLFWVLKLMLLDPQSLINGDNIVKWLKPHRKILLTAMQELEDAGLLEELHEQYLRCKTP